ncbi:MAG: 2-amino-4-hydroxy-6-hydroxymethyldihydropteridine pyrophosphokinase [Chlamydiales bacterium]|nr:2-amino-4-hydroxy-6-hydroxymethyldihydropteridine pyrophosphokinase [Chlamydiales bacterium]MCH9619394.1 2-amino-4-hydroxy-6-hydroxymethyldihydropteridine pyrophosphokinase [Chlamydiales bacterium]MCH9622198.1 2-amino-4-hydroxy-6-hydroxymethyldihydropteridine pyrophosphokinase [Chlamydiales bacterium]
MKLCFVALGANLGSPEMTLKKAIALIEAHPKIFSFVCSTFHQTKPVSEIEQPDFINAVCRFECTLSPIALFSYLEEIEKKLGKVKKPKNAPRMIDLDLIFYGDLISKSRDLTIPHPRWKERTFVIRPLAELL